MQRYFTNKKENDYLEINPNNLHHIKNVMRNKIGDKIECIYKEELFICSIESLQSTKVKILSKEKDNNELNTNITIAIGLVKEQKIDLILQKLTELGVNTIIPLKMERSIVKLDKQKFSKKKERWQTICKEAAEQSKRNKIPEITNIMSIKDLPIKEYDIKLVCSTKEQTNKISNYIKEDIKNKNILIVIGPEGGITEEEENTLVSLGMTKVSLGKRIMRVETATIFIASIINFYSLE